MCHPYSEYIFGTALNGMDKKDIFLHNLQNNADYSKEYLQLNKSAVEV